jgi:hypothetical protein
LTPLTFIDTFDYDGEYLSWATNGFAGTVTVLSGRFSINGDRGLLLTLTKQVNIEYLKYTLEPIFRDLAKGRKGDHGENEFTKLYPSMVEAVEISIPITENGEFDLEAQKDIATQFELVEQLKRELREKCDYISKVIVDVDLSDYEMTFIPITEIFNIERGSGKYTKTYTQAHLGEYPLFSGNTFGAFALIDKYDYDKPCLSWAIDGLAGYMMVHKAPFSATNHRGILVPKTSEIDLDYIRYSFEPILRQTKKGRIGDNGENEYTSLPPFMLKGLQVGLPVDGSGNVSLALQKEIALSYSTIEQYRREVLEKMNALIEQRISY